jgi:hypothetical protein
MRTLLCDLECASQADVREGTAERDLERAGLKGLSFIS